MRIQKNEIEILEKITERFSQKRQGSRKRILLMDYKKFLSCLNEKERKLIRKIQNLDLRKYGKKMLFLGISPTPKDLVMIRGQKHKTKGRVYNVPLQFLPKKTYQAFKKLNQAIKKDLKRPLLIRSGYRSSGFQMILFLNYLKEDNWQIKKTIKRVALPYYSEHGYLLKQGIDFGAVRPTENPQDFAKTVEYKWLKKKAAKFGFHLSYPRNNKTGVMFEPWHWRYKK